MSEEKRNLIKPGLTLFGDSYPKQYLANLRYFFQTLESKGLIEQPNPVKRLPRLKPD